MGVRACQGTRILGHGTTTRPGYQCCLFMQTAKAQNGGVLGRNCNPCWAWLQTLSSSEFPAGIFATGAFGGACHRHRMLPPSHSIRPKQNHGDIWWQVLDLYSWIECIVFGLGSFTRLTMTKRRWVLAAGRAKQSEKSRVIARHQLYQ